MTDQETTEVTEKGALPSDPIADLVSGAREALAADARSLSQIATALAPLGRVRSYADLGKVPGLIESAEKRIAELEFGADRGLEVLEAVRTEVAERRRRMREELAPSLRKACEERGLGLRVVRQEEPVEIRIPPLAVRIDREKGSADLLFARIVVESCAAEAEAILDARERALAALDRGFDPAAFFEACRTAWLAARGAGAAGSGDRVEIRDFLPYLTLQLQRPAFGVDPTASNFVGYSRAQFAWDLLRLRGAGMLNRDGWRLNLGVATGSTATQKKRALWIEDEHGDGEFKLTVFFTRVDSAT